MGTDTGFGITPYGEWHARELELLTLYAGLTPMEAITAGTVNGAKMLGLEHQLGRVAPGYLADLLVVRGNPLDNMRVLLNKDNIRHVIKDGEVQVFDEDDREQRYQFDRQAIVYSRVDLSYEMVCDGDPSPKYTVAPWTLSDGKDILSDLKAFQHGVANETFSTTD